MMFLQYMMLAGLVVPLAAYLKTLGVDEHVPDGLDHEFHGAWDA